MSGSHLPSRSRAAPGIISASAAGAEQLALAWQDCRFRRNCSSNDIVLTTSTDGLTWSPVSRVPIDDVTSTVDHFLPGLAVDRSTSGAGAHLDLAYYSYPQADCGVSTCRLDVGFISSTSGGTSWSGPTQLAGPMSLSWIANTTAGAFVGDYISTSFTAAGSAYPVIEVASLDVLGGRGAASARADGGTGTA